MKRFLFWSFERGSIHYDIICGIIFVLVVFTPRWVFNDRPDFMRVSLADPIVRPSHDDDGNVVYTVKLLTGAFAKEEIKKNGAKQSLAGFLKMSTEAIQPSKMQPVYDYTGALVAYAIWTER